MAFIFHKVYIYIINNFLFLEKKGYLIIFLKYFLLRPARLELATFGFEVQRAIHYATQAI